MYKIILKMYLFIQHPLSLTLEEILFMTPDHNNIYCYNMPTWHSSWMAEEIVSRVDWTTESVELVRDGCLLVWNFVWQGQMYLQCRWKDSRWNVIEFLHQWLPSNLPFKNYTGRNMQWTRVKYQQFGKACSPVVKGQIFLLNFLSL